MLRSLANGQVDASLAKTELRKFPSVFPSKDFFFFNLRKAGSLNAYVLT